jgi:hypothetical protein
MGIPFTAPMGFLFTMTIGFLFTIALGIQLTISTPEPGSARHRRAALLATACRGSAALASVRLALGSSSRPSPDDAMASGLLQLAQLPARRRRSLARASGLSSGWRGGCGVPFLLFQS